MPRISPARTSRSDAADSLVAAVVADRACPSTREHDVARMGLAAIDVQLHVATDHQLGQVVLVRLAPAAACRPRARAG